jgi:hypothetical protein
MGRTYSTYWGEERCKQCFWCEKPEGRRPVVAKDLLASQERLCSMDLVNLPKHVARLNEYYSEYA